MEHGLDTNVTQLISSILTICQLHFTAEVSLYLGIVLITVTVHMLAISVNALLFDC